MCNSSKEHIAAYNKKYRSQHREFCNAVSLRYYWRHCEEKRNEAKERNRRLKLEILSHYSNGNFHCADCGFNDTRALCVDHINNNGAQHRRDIGKPTMTGSTFYRWLKNEGFPEGYQVLCANCNLIKEVRFLNKGG